MTHLRTRTIAKRALAFCALSGLIAVSANAQNAAPADKKNEEVQKLEKFEVTGSRIKRIDTETVSPVTSITAAQIEVQGFNTLGEALQSIPQNSGQILSPTDSGGSFTSGISTLNLRGLGNNNTLVLINGRRAVPYAAPGFSGFQTMFDFNSIPRAAIEKIEILKDGASAIYGSDAVGGVVDIKMRQDYEGLTTSVTVGNFLGTDAFYRKGSALFGTHSAKTSVTVALEWLEQEATFARDFDVSRDADNGSDGTYLQANPKYIAPGWDKVKTVTYSSEEEYLKDVMGSLIPPASAYDRRSSMGYPGAVYVNGWKTFKDPTDNPVASGAIAGYNKYNFQADTGLDPKQRGLSFYSTAKHEITDNLRVFAEVSFTRFEVEAHSAPSPAQLATENGLSAGEGLFIPSYNAYNPWGVDISNGLRRLVECGNRIADVTSDTPRVLVGLAGDLQDHGSLTGWSWEASAMYSKNTVNVINRNTVPDYRLQQALMGLTRMGDGSLAWDPTTVTSQRVFFNWFGVNEGAMSDFLTVNNPNTSTLEYKQFDAKASGNIFSLPAGPVGFAFGIEHRQEVIEKVVSDLNSTGNVIGGSEGTGFNGSRKVTSVYSEVAIPVLKGMRFAESLELQLAGRFEDYSDTGFAKQARPKVAIKYKPVDWLIVRGSFSRCFKAPDLAYLYTASQTTFTSSPVYDPVKEVDINQLQTVVAGNAKLQPELTDVSYIGLAFEPKGCLKGLQVSIDAFRYQQKNLLTQLSDLYGYEEFLAKAKEGDPLFVDKVVRNPVTNDVLFVRDDYENISHGEYKGVDLDIDYLLKTKTLGSFSFGATGTWIHHMSFDSANMAGSYLVPKWKATVNVGWQKGDWAANVMARYFGKRVRNIGLGSAYDEGDSVYRQYTMDPRVIVNASISYKGFRNTKLLLSVQNVLDTDAAMDPLSYIGGTSGAGYVNPTFITFTVEHKF